MVRLDVLRVVPMNGMMPFRRRLPVRLPRLFPRRHPANCRHPGCVRVSGRAPEKGKPQDGERGL